MCNRRFLLYTGSKFSCSELFVINSSCLASPCKPGSHHPRHTGVSLAAKTAAQPGAREPAQLPPPSMAGSAGNEVTVSGAPSQWELPPSYNATQTHQGVGFRGFFFYCGFICPLFKKNFLCLRSVRQKKSITYLAKCPVHGNICITPHS